MEIVQKQKESFLKVMITLYSDYDQFSSKAQSPIKAGGERTIYTLFHVLHTS